MGEGRVELVTGAMLIFASTFVAVFTLGLQSRLVNTENYAGAGINSLFISAGHIALYKVMPESGGVEMLGYFAGGVIGITLSIWFHKRAAAWWASRRGVVYPGTPGYCPPQRWPAPPPARGTPGDEHADVKNCRP